MIRNTYYGSWGYDNKEQHFQEGEMTFEQEFPSLIRENHEFEVCCQTILYHGCLDKKKVRDALKEIKSYVPRDGSFPIEKLIIVIDEQIKRLGL
jgi:hypothetical protein